MAYKPGKDEVIVASYPKCGTTWIMQIVLTILKKGRPCTTAHEYFASNPFLEATGEEGVKHAMNPRCIKTHLPFDRINFSSEAKYIYVARHPADCVLSFYHHIRFFPVYFFSDGSFDDFFEVFIKGEVDFNDYFDNLLSWYKNKDRPNILFLTFESMKSDTKGTVLKIARFLGEDYYEYLVADNEKVLKDVLDCSRLDFMRSRLNEFWREVFVDNTSSEEYQNKNAEAKKYAEVLKEAAQSGRCSVGEFIRKGDVGEGKMILSESQLKKMSTYIKMKTLNNPDLMNLWA